MIVDALLGVVAWLLGVVVSVRPEWDPSFPGPFEQAILLARELNGILPMQEVSNCVLIYLTAFGALYAWKWILKLVDWIADVIP